MKKTIVMIFASAALMLAADQTFTGTITDDMCGGSHKAMNVAPDAKCVTECVRGGAKYALWDGRATYVLSDQNNAAPFAAKKVTVKGTLDAKAKTIQVSSIAAAK
jgi:glutamate-1-semialdehyde aminotransferase